MKIWPITHLSRLPVCATAHSPALCLRLCVSEAASGPSRRLAAPPHRPPQLPSPAAPPGRQPAAGSPTPPARARHSAPPPRLRQIPHRHIPVPAVRRAGRGAPTPASTAGSSAAGYASRRSGRLPVPWWPLSVLEAHALPVCLVSFSKSPFFYVVISLGVWILKIGNWIVKA